MKQLNPQFTADIIVFAHKKILFLSGTVFNQLYFQKGKNGHQQNLIIIFTPNKPFTGLEPSPSLIIHIPFHSIIHSDITTAQIMNYLQNITP